MVVFWGPIIESAITGFVDAILDIPKGGPLDVMLTTAGGGGEVALRMASICRSEREDVRIIVPDMAYSAGTILALAADKILMSSSSTLGPIDPEIPSPEKGLFEWMPAKAMVDAVDNLQKQAQANPSALRFAIAMLGEINAILYQTAKNAMARTKPLATGVLKLRSDPPSDGQIKEIVKALQKHSVHSATIHHQEASDIGLPVKYVDPFSEKWTRVWRLHTRYVADYKTPRDVLVIEGRRLSHTHPKQ